MLIKLKTEINAVLGTPLVQTSFANNTINFHPKISNTKKVFINNQLFTRPADYRDTGVK